MEVRSSWGDAALRAAHGSGLVLTGLSAGAACWFGGYLSDSLGDPSPGRTGWVC